MLTAHLFDPLDRRSAVSIATFDGNQNAVVADNRFEDNVDLPQSTRVPVGEEN